MSRQMKPSPEPGQGTDSPAVPTTPASLTVWRREGWATWTKRRARVAHMCDWCWGQIAPGETYIHYWGPAEEESRPLANYLHAVCDAARLRAGTWEFCPTFAWGQSTPPGMTLDEYERAREAIEGFVAALVDEP